MFAGNFSDLKKRLARLTAEIGSLHSFLYVLHLESQQLKAKITSCKAADLNSRSFGVQLDKGLSSIKQVLQFACRKAATLEEEIFSLNKRAAQLPVDQSALRYRSRLAIASSTCCVLKACHC